MRFSLRSLLSFVSFIFISLACVFQAAHADVWMADEQSLHKLDLAANRIAFSVPASKIKQLAVDPRDGSVWALTEKKITKRTASGVLSFEAELKTLGLKESDYLALDAHDGSLWIGDGKADDSGVAGNDKRIVRLNSDGAVVYSFASPGKIEGLSVALDGSLWVLGQKRLFHYTQQGVTLANVDLKPLIAGDPKLFLVDSIGAWVWAAAEKRLIRIDAATPTTAPLTLTLPNDVDALTADQQLGRIWIVAQRQLLAYSQAGVLEKTIALNTISVNEAKTLAFDPVTRSLLLGHERGLTHLNEDGANPVLIPASRTIEVTGVSPFVVSTELLLEAPLSGALINNPTAQIVLQLKAMCSGNACGFATGFYNGYTLSVKINGQELGAAFTVNPATGKATYQPATAYNEGLNSVIAQATDSFGQISNTLNFSFTLDSIAPSFISLLPSTPYLTNTPLLRIGGRISEPATLNINTTPVPVAADNTFSYDFTLSEGLNTVTLVATDLAGNSASRVLAITRDSVAPAAVVGTSLTFGTATPNVVAINGAAGSVEAGAVVRIKNLRSGETVEVLADANGAFTAQINGGAGDQLQIVVLDGAGNSSASTTATVPGGSGTLPPDPTTVAPPVDRTVDSILANTTAFLYSGANPIQTGVAPGMIEAKRAAVLRGKVQSRDNQPLSGVKISILNHPEFGQTLSRADGMFDLAVNGGGVLTLRYEKSGYLAAQRQINTSWQDFAFSPDVVLIALDAQVSTIAVNAAVTQVARGSVSTDTDGARRATMLFAPGTTATMTLPDGSTLPLTTLNVRATEYTVGANGPNAMPATLPPTSGYTYAVELSVDEAIAAGAKDVNFSQPVPVYVENFLNFPVGGIVPAGYYDRDKAAWIPAPNGRVIKILAIVGGMASLDTDGDGLADDAAKLAALNITDAERAQLATLYAAGQTLWRVPVSHFTPWDCNWPYGPPPDATDPKQPELKDDEEDKCDECDGSIIETQNQTLGERLPIMGTPFSLNYKSDRVFGRKVANTINISLSGASVPASLRRIELVINVAGRQFNQTFSAASNQRTTFAWDGKDAYGRSLQGSQAIEIQIGYVYGAVYQLPVRLAQSFGAASGALISGSRARQEITLWQKSLKTVQAWDARTLGLGGWSASIHHTYDPNQKILLMGDGTRRSAQSINSVITTVAGLGPLGFGGDGGPATAANLYSPRGVALDPLGNLFIADTLNSRIRKVSPAGIITTVAGNGALDSNGDNGPATAASIFRPLGVTIDPQGNLIIADTYNSRIRKVNPAGIITTVAGNGTNGFSGDGGAATVASLLFPQSVTVDSQGNMFIVDASNNRIRKVSPAGIITTVAGNGVGGFGGDGGAATAASLYSPSGVVLDSQGNLFIADTYNSRIRKLSPDGVITTVAGNNTFGFNGDGGEATAASLYLPYGVSTDSQGNLFIADKSNNIRKVNPAGIINTVAGNGTQGFSGDGGTATAARLNGPANIAIDPQGNLFIADASNNRIRKVAPPFPGFDRLDLLIPSADGTQHYHFDPTGRHLRTLDTKTRAVLYSFTYDSKGLLIQITDGDGDITRIERDTAGNPTAIVSADNLRTTLTLDANGYLASIANPAAEAYRMTYSADGLLTTFTDPKGNASTMTYDAAGRLIRDQNAAGGFWTLARSTLANGYEAHMTSAENRSTTYRVENLSIGTQRRTNLFPDGTQSIALIENNGATTRTAPDGSVSTSIEGPDPRFGMQAPLQKSLSVRLPSGLTSSITTARTVSLADPFDLLSLTRETTTVAINGRSFTSVFDAAARQYTGTSAEGRASTTRIDPQGRPTFAQLSGVEALNYAYDARGRLQTVTQGTGTDTRSLTYTYGPDGFIQRITDAATQATVYQRDAAGRVTQAALPDNRIVGFSFDANGNLASLTPPGRPAHGFAYTPVDLESQYTPPAIGLPTPQTQYAYNLDKQLTSVIRPDGASITLGYDSAGRSASVTPSAGAGSSVTYGYSAATGQLNAVGNANITLGYSFDGALLKQETFSGAITGSIARNYDSDFRTTQLTVNGAAAAFAYDRDSLLTSVGAMTLTRNPANGFLTGSTLGSVTTTQSYNAFGELASFAANSGATPLYSYTLTHDKLGRIITKTETTSGVTTNFEYGYDLAGRLASVKQNGVTVRQYGYDANGNRLTLVSGAVTTSATYDNQDRIQTYGANAYTFGANGELKTKTAAGQTTNYVYDVFGNLTSVTLPDSTLIEYLADGRNRRVGKKVNGTLVQGFLYQGQLRIAAEVDATGNVVSRFIYGTKINVPEYMTKGADTYRIVTDHLGSVRLVVNSATGIIAQRIEYDEFGNVLLDTNPGFQPFGFAGGLYDKDTKLVRFGARDFEAETGRWLSKDPIKFKGRQTNLYLYALASPISLTDPNGLEPGSLYQRGYGPEYVDEPGLDPVYWEIVLIPVVAPAVFQYSLARAIIAEVCKPKSKPEQQQPLNPPTKPINEINKELREKLGEAEKIDDMWLRNQARLDAIAEGMSQQGFSAEQITNSMRGLQGGFIK